MGCSFFSSLLQELNSDKVKPEFNSGKKPEIEYSGCHEYCTRHHAICALSDSVMDLCGMTSVHHFTF